MTAAARDTWIYDTAHQVCYHAASQTYAIPDAVTGEWSYLPARDFRPGQPSTSSERPPRGASGSEREDGEVDDDVGWGGLMEPDKLERAIKGGGQGNGANSNGNGNGISTAPRPLKNPAYTGSGPGSAGYDDPRKYAWMRDPTPPPRAMSSDILRLVVLESEALEAGQVAVIDAREGGVQIGRDRVEGGGQARLRVKEMEVSKTHAVVYFGRAEEEDGDGWWIVDLGSTQGTFLTAAAGEDVDDIAESVRLSEPKESSKPHYILHLSTIRVGATTFSAHIHPSWPCGECQLTGENEIRLDDGTKPDLAKVGDTSDLGAGGVRFAMDSKERRENREMKRKREMAALKESLLNPAGAGSGTSSGRSSPAPAQEQRQYIDRSAMRRKLHPPSPPAHHAARAAELPPETRLMAAPEPAPPPKFAMAMLANQGWTPGTGLGKSGEGRAEPVQVEVRTEKRGLGAEGSKAVVDDGPGDWRSRGKQRTYDRLRSGP